MKKHKRGRHAPAFVLLILAKKPAYGLEILNKLNNICTENTIDSAAIYRALKALENDKRLTSQWIESESGAPKKVYSITALGIELLAEYKEDIVACINNLNSFICLYDELKLN
ncbi:PadR family transcriptional regulator [Clostridium sp. 'deep sea']|uniref:PadR family transcriptional regulator n=1 Tax=Clostridium sp. 'deep sea' TaxID=2779445 RepID=UPI0018965C60|nr:PadR family transcriptional regulator [Clostridium sp. 'deep sea']QOR36687.1 PadR family transcriptional regulator [Clostridium sp. 'deep sea']